MPNVPLSSGRVVNTAGEPYLLRNEPHGSERRQCHEGGERLVGECAARIAAGLGGAAFVTPDDVKSVLALIVPHRLVLAPDAVLDGVSEHEVVATLLEQVPAPR